MLRLEQRWLPEGAVHGGFRFRLVNLSDRPVPAARFCYSSMTRLRRDATVSGGRLIRTFANHVEIAPERGLEPGGCLDILVTGLTHKPQNRTQGAMAAWIETEAGEALPMEAGDLIPPEGTPRGTPFALPAGRLALPLGLVPWPQRVAIAGFGPAPLLCPGHDAMRAAMAQVAALHRRLFPAAPAPFSLDGEAGTPVASAADPALPPGGYRIAFGAEIALSHADPDGLRHGLVTLAQIAHAARSDPRFAFPSEGEIGDAPRFGWRGCHLDVARNFHPAATVLRLIDICAWLKLNRLHWHLTDDEGWRLPSAAFQGLTGQAATRARGTGLPPQYADGPEGQSGAYTPAEVAAVVARGAALGVPVMPELDMPGHAAALLGAISGLRDPQEAPDSYRSIQGYPNNALNPALPRSYQVAETLLSEAAAMFPGSALHVGGDEVNGQSWSQSPAAQALAAREGLSGAAELEAHFLRRIHGFVRALGRDMAAWDEAADGGGIDTGGSLIFAWRSAGKTAELIARGYDVVATPGQAYYLDMVWQEGWDAAGTSWAGVVTPETTYRFEPAADLPEGPGRLVGVQGCLWSEHLNSTARLNAAAFPRLAAVAEAAWTPAEAKDWDRFCALAPLVPQL